MSFYLGRVAKSTLPSSGSCLDFIIIIVLKISEMSVVIELFAARQWCTVSLYFNPIMVDEFVLQLRWIGINNIPDLNLFLVGGLVPGDAFDLALRIRGWANRHL